VDRHWPPSLVAGLVLLATVAAFAAQQEQKPEEKKTTAAPIPALVRLAAAKTALLKRAGSGGHISFDVVSDTLEGWRRFTLVNTAEKADIIIEVFSSKDNDIAAATTMRTSPQTGRPERSASTGKQFASPEIRLTIYDAKTSMPLWTATEHPKYALKRKDIENHEVEAAERVVTRLHDLLEPPSK
jgi:hypothetical protein